MGMLRLVRAFTGREKIVKFEGCYHGHADSFLVQAGSGVATLGLPDSPGVPKAATTATLCAQYNNLESVEELLKSNDVAAVILEPVVGNSGFIAPTKDFLVCGKTDSVNFSSCSGAGWGENTSQMSGLPRILGSKTTRSLITESGILLLTYSPPLQCTTPHTTACF